MGRQIFDKIENFCFGFNIKYLKHLINICTPGCKVATDPAAVEEGDARGHGDVAEAGHGLARRDQQEAFTASRQGLQEEQERLRQQRGG